MNLSKGGGNHIPSAKRPVVPLRNVAELRRVRAAQMVIDVSIGVEGIAVQIK